MSPLRLLTASVVLVGTLAGCGAGLNDQTSRERSTPYVAGASVGPIKVRDVVVTVTGSSRTGSASPSVSPTDATSASPSPSGTAAAGGDTGETQGYLSFVLVNAGTSDDTITSVQVGNGGGVSPSDASATGTIKPGQTLVFGGETAGSSGGAAAVQLAISGLTQPLLPGTTVPVTIGFQNAGQVTIQAPVRASS